MGIIEVVIAMFLTLTGIMALLALQPQGWRTMARADYLGRASGILYKTLENNETLIMNPCYAPTEGTQTTPNICVSGNTTALSGDICYTVTTTITKVTAAGVKPRVYLVTVTVTWPPINTTGISESQTVDTQSQYAFPTGCAEI